MKQDLRIVIVCAALALCCIPALALEDFRKPVGGGTYYPAEPDVLKAKVNALIAEADTPPDTGRMIACIMPNAPYGFSGAVAAHAVKNIKDGDYDRVIVLGCSHIARFENCTLPAVRSFMTPMGFVPLDGEIIGKLDYSPMYWLKDIRYSGSANHTPIHEKEHSVEVVLPFLQARLGNFKLIPILVGQFNSQGQGINLETVDAAADDLKTIVNDRSLIVVSTNFTHYGKEYNYTPFRENVEENIKKLDQAALDLICKLDASGFIDYLRKTRNPIPGHNAILLLLQTLPPGCTARLVAQDRSTNMVKDPNSDTSVSYAAIQFYAPSAATKE